MTSPKFLNDGTLDSITLYQALNIQTINLTKEIDTLRGQLDDIKKDVTALNKNIEKIVEILNQSNPRAKNLMIRSYPKSGVAAPFLKDKN
jgi:predicted  nucleic acid-binding Zn-ribbon protein